MRKPCMRGLRIGLIIYRLRLSMSLCLNLETSQRSHQGIWGRAGASPRAELQCDFRVLFTILMFRRQECLNQDSVMCNGSHSCWLRQKGVIWFAELLGRLSFQEQLLKSTQNWTTREPAPSPRRGALTSESCPSSWKAATAVASTIASCLFYSLCLHSECPVPCLSSSDPGPTPGLAQVFLIGRT